MKKFLPILSFFLICFAANSQTTCSSAIALISGNSCKDSVVIGNKISSTKLNNGSNKTEINTTCLDSGIYVYKVIIDNEFKTSNKLIISK